MPLTITKQDGKFCVTDPAGKNFGCHATKQGAINQIGAIESNKSKSGIELMADHQNRILAAELHSSPVILATDGTPEGTVILIHGQSVPFKQVDMYCSHEECTIHITMNDTNEHGIVVERSLTLRKEPLLSKEVI